MRVTAIAIALLLPLAAQAQQPQAQPPSATAQFVGQVSTLLATTLEERDAARAQTAACQQAAAHPPPASAQTSTPEAPKQP